MSRAAASTWNSSTWEAELLTVLIAQVPGDEDALQECASRNVEYYKVHRGDNLENAPVRYYLLEELTGLPGAVQFNSGVSRTATRQRWLDDVLSSRARKARAASARAVSSYSTP